MEDDDLFIRTLDDVENDAPIPSDDDDADNSDLEFNLNDDRDETPFFQVERPAGWDLSSAKENAEKQRPFQTSIDSKIRATLAKMPAPKIPSLPAHASKKKRAAVQGADESAQGDASSSGDDGDDDSGEDEGEEEMEMEIEPKRKAGKKRARKEAAAKSMVFEDLCLSRALLKSVGALEWTQPTPVQVRAIPHVLSGRDVCGSAVTGSGKTGAFVLPILERLIQAGVDNVTRVVILLPTRELAAQCHAVIVGLAKYTTIRSALAVGGLSNLAQESALRTRPHILVCTPGRLIDHIRNARGFALDDVEVMVMDEADRLLDMGFKDEVEEILRYTPTKKQTLLFSATMNARVGELVKLSLRNPIYLQVDASLDVAKNLSQEFVKLKSLHEANKDAVLLALINRTYTSRVIVFFKHKVTAHRFRILLGLCNKKAAELHGNLTQAEYVHRVGRTARAGKSGKCCSLVCSDRSTERKVLNAVAKKARDKVSARVVAAKVVGKWRAWIDSMERAVRNVLKEEKQEKVMRMAEMELNKADNIMKHEAEIFGRPKRTWFQSSREKKVAKESGRMAKGLGPSKQAKRDEQRKRGRSEQSQVEAAKDENNYNNENGISNSRNGARRENKHITKQKVDARKAKRRKTAKANK